MNFTLQYCQALTAPQPRNVPFFFFLDFCRFTLCGMFWNNLDTPTWPFSGNLLFGTWRYYTDTFGRGWFLVGLVWSWPYIRGVLYFWVSCSLGERRVWSELSCPQVWKCPVCEIRISLDASLRAVYTLLCNVRFHSNGLRFVNDWNGCPHVLHTWIRVFRLWPTSRGNFPASV